MGAVGRATNRGGNAGQCPFFIGGDGCLMTRHKITPELKTYYEIRWLKCFEEIRHIAEVLGWPDPIPNKAERRELREETCTNGNKIDVPIQKW